ncbi:MAG: aminodeoxychorismate synthase component I [Syntrophales bacterium]
MNRLVIRDPEAGQWLWFETPRTVLLARSLSDVAPLLAEADRLVRQEGCHAAGWIGYEAAPAFDRALRTRTATAFPLACLGIFGPPAVLPALPPPLTAARCETWQPTVGQEEYAAAIGRIKGHIARGDTYQVNYTLRLVSAFGGDPWGLFLATCGDAPYAAFVDTDAFALCSASPELFFSLAGERIHSRPMKGTAARGRTPAEDRASARWLYRSEKNRAENVMIVDMIRNDLGRIARTGSVRVPRLYSLERYPTVWQMTSTVEARTQAPLPEIMGALFPCASITGAPKVKTMEIIAAIETTPRNIYTGAIGLLAPGRRARFSVAIRTVLIDKAASAAEYGLGGGIVWDSTAQEEYEECLIKAKILLPPAESTSGPGARRLPQTPRPSICSVLPGKRRRPDDERGEEFQLLETLRWTPAEGYFLLPRHLERLQRSARHFGYRYDEALINAALAEAAGLPGTGEQRVRLRLFADGTAECDSAPLVQWDGRPLKVRLALHPIAGGDPFVLHKTTRREHYDAARAPFPDADDVILHNEAGEVTESCIANVVILREKRLVTPPLGCGLLAGTFRAELLERGEIREERVTIGELRAAEKIFLVNSVRKWREAVLLSDKKR